jgi:indoleamine 2,3-dioxygenase
MLSPDHFLPKPRPDPNLGPSAGVPDTSTLAAHDFDVDTRTGFMPPDPPLTRLPAKWEPWEAALDSAMNGQLESGEVAVSMPLPVAAHSEAWRIKIRQVIAIS